MKSVVSTIAVLFAVATLAACSKKEAAPAPVTPPAATAPAAPAPAEVAAPAATPAPAPAEPVKQEEKK